MQTQIIDSIAEIQREINLRELPEKEILEKLDALKLQIEEFGDARYSEGWDNAVINQQENDNV